MFNFAFVINHSKSISDTAPSYCKLKTVLLKLVYHARLIGLFSSL
ncbi:hypothetical protein ACPF04_06980 [Campylobacter sp. MOP51]